MRRWGIVGLALALSAGGCNVLRDAFSAHPGAAARVAGQTLSVDRLVEIAARVRGAPLDEATLTRVVNVYVDYMLFALSEARGENLGDSVLVARTMWPMLSQLKFDRFIARLEAGHDLGKRDIDSLYAHGDLRAFQHILIVVPSNATPTVVQQKQAAVNRLWQSLVANGGTNFAAVARRSSEDPGTKASGGYLDVGGRGRFTPPFEDAAWRLSPGAMSGVVRTNFGFHIIRRPPLSEIRDSFVLGIQRVLAQRYDSTYMSDLTKQRDVRVASTAGPAVRTALQDMAAAERSDTRLASYRGGEFRMKDMIRWLYALDPRLTQQLAQANDSQMGTLVLRLTERSIVLQQADSAKVQPSDSEWAGVRAEYDSTLAGLRTALKLDSLVLKDSASTAEARAVLALRHVDDYFDRLMAGQAEFVAVPPLLAQALRERHTWSIDATGVRDAALRATSLRARVDSLQPPPAGAGGGTGVRPAPGPAPVPGASDSGARPSSSPRTPR